MRLLILISILLSLVIGQASQETHGGNGTVADFFAIYNSLMKPELRTCYDSVLQNSEYTELQNLRRKLEVRSEPQVFFEGKSVGAINQPLRSPPLLVLSEEKWKTSSEKQKRALVLHELMHLLGFQNESPSYTFSAPIAACVNQILGPSYEEQLCETIGPALPSSNPAEKDPVEDEVNKEIRELCGSN